MLDVYFGNMDGVEVHAETPEEEQEAAFILNSALSGKTTFAIHLGTGRHHQIRVQMAGAGAPLWGDNKYNPEFVNKRGYFPIALRAFRLSFCHCIRGIYQRGGCSSYNI